MSSYDPTALGSDVARSRSQALMRRFARLFVSAFGLNSSGALATEIVQAIQPTARIDTSFGPLFCRTGHGRLRWRAETFFTEEPQTIEWLNGLNESSVLWDVGANVGLYSVYAARHRGCKVLALEPESQNFALLIDNIALNGVAGNCVPACLAVADKSHLGSIAIRYVTKGGAYNHFDASQDGMPYAPESAETRGAAKIQQMVYGVSLDDLAYVHGQQLPTHLKIDVDGLEPEIIAGASRLLAEPGLRSILIELNRNVARDMAIPDILRNYGFRVVNQRSNWESRDNNERQNEVPTINVIFAKD